MATAAAVEKRRGPGERQHDEHDATLYQVLRRYWGYDAFRPGRKAS